MLVKIYELLPVDSSEAMMYRAIFEGVEGSLHHAKLMKTSTTIMDNFYFAEFHPIDSYTLEVSSRSNCSGMPGI